MSKQIQPENKPFSAGNSIRNTLIDSANNTFQCIKNNPWKSLAITGLALATGGTGLAIAGGIGAGLVAIKTTKDIANDYAQSNPDGTIDKIVKSVKSFTTPFKKVWNVIKSAGRSLKKIGTTITQNKWKAVGLAVGAVVVTALSGGAALPFIVAAASVGITAKVATDMYKDHKYGHVAKAPTLESGKVSNVVQNTAIEPEQKKITKSQEIRQYINQSTPTPTPINLKLQKKPSEISK